MGWLTNWLLPGLAENETWVDVCARDIPDPAPRRDYERRRNRSQTRKQAR